jgi:predicted nucleotide-binding protein
MDYPIASKSQYVKILAIKDKGNDGNNPIIIKKFTNGKPLRIYDVSVMTKFVIFGDNKPSDFTYEFLTDIGYIDNFLQIYPLETGMNLPFSDTNTYFKKTIKHPQDAVLAMATFYNSYQRDAEWISNSAEENTSELMLTADFSTIFPGPGKNLFERDPYAFLRKEGQPDVAISTTQTDNNIFVSTCKNVEKGDSLILKWILNWNELTSWATIRGPNEEVEILEIPPVNQPELGSNRGDVGTFDPKKIFIVHGREDTPKFELAHFLTQKGLEPIILGTETSSGGTIFEKFEKHGGKVGYAIIIVTPDDKGSLKDGKCDKNRPRQNVILEAGFFMGQLKRNRVCFVYKDDSNWEMPTDLSGIAYYSFNKQIKECFSEIEAELKNARYLEKQG